MINKIEAPPPDLAIALYKAIKKVRAASACPDGRLHHNTAHVVSSTHPSGICIVLDCTSIIAYYMQLSRWCRIFSFTPQYIASKTVTNYNLLLCRLHFRHFDIGAMAAALSASVAAHTAALLMRMPNIFCRQIYGADNY